MSLGPWKNLNQSNKAYFDLLVDSGNIYTCIDPNDISDKVLYQVGGVGNFVNVPTQTTNRTYRALCSNGSDIYAITYDYFGPSVIYKQTGKTGNFNSVQTLTTDGGWDIAAVGTDIYTVSYQNAGNLTVRKQTASSGSFNVDATFTGSWGKFLVASSNLYLMMNRSIWQRSGGSWASKLSFSYDECHNMCSNGTDIYAVTNPNATADIAIYTQNGGSGSFSLLQTISNPTALSTLKYVNTFSKDGDVYISAMYYTSNIKAICYLYKQTGGSGSFIAIDTNADYYLGTVVVSGNNAWAADIYSPVENQYFAGYTKSYVILRTGPLLSSVSPSSGIYAGQTVTISGVNLQGISTTVLTIDGNNYSANITSLGSSSIEFTAPSLTPGSYSVVITTDNLASNSLSISYPAPVITDVDPESEIHYGALVTIIGTDLQGATSTAIEINGVDYSSEITSASLTKITFLAPDLADGSYDLTVILDGSVSSEPFTITYSSGSTIDVSIRSPYLYQHFENDDGTPLYCGKVYTYYAGTTTPLATIDCNGVDNTNPVYLDAAGNADIWLKPGYSYKFIVTDQYDNTISSGVQDNITGSSALDTISGTGVTVETIAQLKLLTAGVFNYATVLGYSAKTDSIGPRLYYWDSASTLTDDGGSVIKITATATGRWKLVAGKEIDAKWFGATGNGTTNDQTALYNASAYLTAIGGGKLILSYGSYNITSALTLGTSVELVPLPGAYFKSTNGSNLTINNMALTGNSKRFDSTLGTISFGSSVEYVLPEWFGASGDGVTDDSSAIQKALDSCSKVVFSGKTYKVTTGLTANVSQEIIGGDAILSPNANAITVLAVPQCSTAADAVKISRLNITNAATKTGITGLYATRSSYLNITDVYVKDVETGVSLSAGQNQNVINLTVKSCSAAGLKLIGPAIEDFIGNDFSSITLDGNQVGLMAYTGAGGSNALKNITFNGINLVNNTVAGGYFKDVVVSITGLQLYSNGTGSASCTIDSKTIYKSDLYLDAATVSINDSEIDSNLNNSIQLINSACLNTHNFTGYASSTNTQMLVELGSKVVETGITTATGYKEWLMDYGKIKSIDSPLICYGIGKAIPIIAGQYKLNKIRFPQYPTVTVNAPATGSHDNVCGLTRAITIANSIGSSGTNSASISMGTGLSAPYQISTILVMSDTNKEYMVKWSDNSGSYQHAYIAPTNKATWVRHVFITHSKTSHTFEIWPTGASSSIIFLKDAMCYDGILEEVSNIYQNGLVYYTEYGNWNSAAPTAGTWEKGDIVYNMDPDSAEYIGWVCTVAGTPGTWKTFGLIS